MERSLENHLASWRAERPDEWTMDEFISKAIKIENSNKALLEALEAAKSKIELSHSVHDALAKTIVYEALEIIETAIALARGN